MSCKNDSGLKKHSFDLTDESGNIWAKIIIKLPEEFDTSYSWINSNPEIECGGSVDYRSHSKMHEVIQEVGIMQTPYLDSGYYFTIVHSRFAKCDTTLPSGKKDFIDFEKDLHKRNPSKSPELKIDTSVVIHGLTYDILSYNELLGKSPFNRLEAYTRFNNRNIMITFQNDIHPKLEFYVEVERSLKSLKIQSP